MSKIRKITAVLGIKGLLAAASLTTIALALVVYTASVTMAPTMQFTLGATTASWNVYVNQVNEVRYLPGGNSAPVDSSTNAFRVTTDANKVCAVQIQLTSAMSSALFSNFDITVSYWVGGTGWVTATLYTTATGSTTMSSIDGLTTNAGYIQQAASADTYYLVKVTYSYDLVDTTTPVTAIFQYTPLPADA
jgi:hypothetical protein